ncbi:hypothetical protein [Congregibacter litoralis]|nr:hypothetical protein [Congregibacter litoralis]
MSKFRNCAVLLIAFWTAVAMAQKPTIVVDEDGLLKFEGRNCGNTPIPYMIHELNRMQLEAEGKSEFVSIQERNLEQGEEAAKEQNRENLSDHDT